MKNNSKYITALIFLFVLLFCISSCSTRNKKEDLTNDKNLKSESFNMGRYFKLKRVFITTSKYPNTSNYLPPRHEEIQIPIQNAEKQNIVTEIIKPEKKPNEAYPKIPEIIPVLPDSKNDSEKIEESPSQGAEIQNSEKELESYWNNIDEITQSAQNYYNEYFNKTRLITKDGFFYNKAAGTYVDLNFLCENENLHYRYKNIAADVLLMNPVDLAQYKEISIKSSEIENGLTVFAAIKHPSKDAYIIGSLESRGGIISSEQYRILLNKYSQNHGSTRRLYADASEYQRILNFICMYEGRYDTFAVRNITIDDKYAMVVLSSSQNTADVKQYLLVKDGNLWQVVMDGLENEPRVIVAVNKKFPDFNTSMIPQYTINDYKKSIKTNFNDVYHLLISLGQISSIDDIRYIAGTDKYCFAVSNNETKFLLTAQNETWIIDKVLSTDDARRQMEDKEHDAPTFIILDN